MKRLIVSFLVMTLCITLFPISAKAETIGINKTSNTIYVGDTFKLQVSGTDQYVLWKSSNSSVVSVTKYGRVTGKSVGKATISVTVGAGKNGKKFKCVVDVISRLGTKEHNIILSEDEYEEIKIDWKDQREGEILLSVDDNTLIASTEWTLNKQENLLKIIPQDIGFTKSYVCIGNDEGYDNVKYLDSLILNVFVVQDSEWISDDMIEDFSGESLLDYISNEYEVPSFDQYSEDDGMAVEFDEDKIYVMSYNGISVRYKYAKIGDVMYSTEDLNAAGIL